MPLNDDYFTVVQYGLRYLALPSAGQRLLYIAGAQHMEYKFVFEHLFISADLSLTRHLHLSFLQFAGDLFLPAISLLLWRLLARPGDDLRQRALRFLPASLLFWGLDYVDALNFPSASLDYLPAIFFTFAAILLLVRPKPSWPSFALACLCFVLAAFSAVNALLLFPIGAWLLLRRRAWSPLLVWTASAILGLAPYLYRYQPMQHQALRSFRLMPVFFISFVGCAAPVHQLALPFGLAVLGLGLRAWRRGFAQIHPASFWSAVWLLLSAAMTAYGRSSYGLQMSLSSRYQVFSALLLVFSYQTLLIGNPPLKPRRAQQVYVFAVVLSLLLFLRADYLGIRYFTERRQDLTVGLEQYRIDPVHGSPMYFTDPEHERIHAQDEAKALGYTSQAIQAGILTLPSR